MNVFVLVGAFLHNRGFWKGKAEVPFVEGFNEGIRRSQDVWDLMVVLGVGWGAIGLVGVIWG